MTNPRAVPLTDIWAAGDENEANKKNSQPASSIPFGPQDDRGEGVGGRQGGQSDGNSFDCGSGNGGGANEGGDGVNGGGAEESGDGGNEGGAEEGGDGGNGGGSNGGDGGGNGGGDGDGDGGDDDARPIKRGKEACPISCSLPVFFSSSFSAFPSCLLHNVSSLPTLAFVGPPTRALLCF